VLDLLDVQKRFVVRGRAVDVKVVVAFAEKLDQFRQRNEIRQQNQILGAD
tara:strand:- start:2915 stop:3064 length:150 start_codon:yes stop_codon:yes gene_type:complete